MQPVLQYGGGICENPSLEKLIFKIPSPADIDGRMKDRRPIGAAGAVVSGRRAKLATCRSL
jgi:hypothetical protein